MSSHIKKIPPTPTTRRDDIQFWENADFRCSHWKEIRRRLEALEADCQADSVQKKLACKRLTFVAVQLESIERKAIESGHFESGKYITLANTMTCLLRLVGMDKKVKTANLQSYLKQKGKSA